jgi:hypothetical protein
VTESTIGQLDRFVKAPRPGDGSRFTIEVAFGRKSNSFLFCWRGACRVVFLSMVFFYGLSIAFAARPALAVNCSLPVCIKECARLGGGTQCSGWCDKSRKVCGLPALPVIAPLRHAERPSMSDCRGKAAPNSQRFPNSDHLVAAVRRTA